MNISTYKVARGATVALCSKFCLAKWNKRLTELVQQTMFSNDIFGRMRKREMRQRLATFWILFIDFSMLPNPKTVLPVQEWPVSKNKKFSKKKVSA